MNEYERQQYYRYDLRNPATMVHHEVPFLDPHFNRELLKLAGKDIFGDPILRIVWAGTLRETKYHEDANGKTQEYQGMKYAFIKRNVITGYTYINDKGHRVTVKTPDLVPKGKVYQNQSHMDELGTMKWVVEMKYSAQDLETLGYYPKLGSAKADQWCVKDGQRYRVKPSRTGEYLKAFFIEMPESMGYAHFGYRDPRESDLEEIKRIWWQAHNESDEDYVKRKMENIDKMLAVEAAAKQAKMDNALEDAIVRAEKLPINPVFFTPKGKEK
jgi:hypothetical protein